MAEKKTKLPPILFVHGGYVDSSCWEPHFIPFFNAAGVDCYALDLAGHGLAGCTENLNELGLDDYAQNIEDVVKTLPELPVIVGHSMGALATEIYVGKGPARAQVLVSPVPPTGTTRSAFFISLANPGFVSAITNIKNGDPSPQDVETMTQVYFAPGTDPRDTLKYQAYLQPESQRAVMEMAFLPLRLPFMFHWAMPDVPTMVMGGDEDRVFPFWTLSWTATPWKTKPVHIEGAGHMLMLDPQWQDAATAILGFMKEL